VNGRPSRRDGFPYSSRNDSPAMAPHNIYEARGDDQWFAVACRDDRDWSAIADVIGASDDGAWARHARYETLAGRLEHQDELDERMNAWCYTRDKFELQHALLAVDVPAVAVQLPEERIDFDPGTTEFGLWPWVDHPAMGKVRVDGFPYHLSETDWEIEHAAPLLGQHNDYVFGEVLGLSSTEVDDLRADGVI